MASQVTESKQVSSARREELTDNETFSFSNDNIKKYGIRKSLRRFDSVT